MLFAQFTGADAVPIWVISRFALTAFTGHQAVGVGYRGAFHPASGETNSEALPRGARKDSGAHVPRKSKI